jgi:iron complex outermembrane receptor protein
VKYEEVTDFEFGAGYIANAIRANLNFYWMDYTNEIVSNGQVDVTGQPVYWNAGKSIHRGIEMEFEYNLPKDIFSSSSFKFPPVSLTGNLSLTDNYFLNYFEKNSIDTLGVIHGNDYSGNKILLNPRIIGNLALNINTETGFSAYLAIQYIGKQFIDNSENEKKNPDARLVPGYVDKIIKPYTVVNAVVSLDLVQYTKAKFLIKYFKFLEASLRMNNILNTYYSATGGIDVFGTPNWIPAADRNLFLNLRIGF